jgi:hypothetical protein
MLLDDEQLQDLKIGYSVSHNIERMLSYQPKGIEALIIWEITNDKLFLNNAFLNADKAAQYVVSHPNYSPGLNTPSDICLTTVFLTDLLAKKVKKPDSEEYIEPHFIDDIYEHIKNDVLN